MMNLDELALNGRNGVYYPREDSHLLAKAVETYAFGKTLDLGTGTGILGLVAGKKGCDVTFSDVNPDAIECAWENSRLNGLSGKFVVSNMFNEIEGKFDTVIFNPPYLISGKRKDMALDGGSAGRELIDG